MTIQAKETAYSLIAAMTAMRHDSRAKPKAVADEIMAALGDKATDSELDRMTDTLATMVSELSERANAKFDASMNRADRALAVLGQGEYRREVRP